MKLNLLIPTAIFKYAILLSFACAHLSTSAQAVEPAEPEEAERSYPTKNYSVYANFGTVILSTQVSLSLERKIWQHNNFRTKAKLSYGNYISNHFDFDEGAKIYDNFFGLAAVQLISLFELNAGLGVGTYTLARGFGEAILNPDSYYEEKRTGLTLYGNAGMRFESDRFLLRFGVGNLEYLYLGVGVNF